MHVSAVLALFACQLELCQHACRRCHAEGAQLTFNVYLHSPFAGQMAAAVHGLNPKINIRTQGEGASSSDAMAPLRNLFTSLPPMLVSYFAPLPSLQPCRRPACSPYRAPHLMAV